MGDSEVGLGFRVLPQHISSGKPWIVLIVEGAWASAGEGGCLDTQSSQPKTFGQNEFFFGKPHVLGSVLGRGGKITKSGGFQKLRDPFLSRGS